MSTTPGNGWPGSPPPQGPGTPPPWGAPPWPQNGQPPPPPAGQPPGAGTPGFDPRQALGAQPPAQVSINQFAPPPNRTPLLVTIAALIVLVLVIGGGIYVRSLSSAESTASTRPTTTATAGPGQPFTTPDGRQDGRWEILDSSWTDEGLQLRLRIHSDDGAISFSFMAFSNASTDLVRPTSSPRAPDIRMGTATVQQPVTGYVFFPMSKGDATIILANGSGRQMSALTVKG